MKTDLKSNIDSTLFSEEFEMNNQANLVTQSEVSSETKGHSQCDNNSPTPSWSRIERR